MSKESNPAEISRALRRMLGWCTQAELAAKLLVSRNYISHIEAGIKEPSKRLLAQMQDLLTEAINAQKVSDREVGEPTLGHSVSEPAAHYLAQSRDTTRIVRELRELFQHLLNLTGGDPKKLGWLFEELDSLRLRKKSWESHLQGAATALVGAEADQRERLRRAGIDPDTKEKPGQDVA